MLNPNNDPAVSKLLSILCHFSNFFSSTFIAIGVPIAILLLCDDPVVKGNAKSSINFQISFFMWAILCFVLAFFLLGFFLFIPLVILSIVCPIFAIIACAANPRRVYEYPLTISIL